MSEDEKVEGKSEDESFSESPKNYTSLLYSLVDTPPWHLCIFFGLQVRMY